MEEKDWIVITGYLINTGVGGGLEFFGPFTEEQAKKFQSKISLNRPPNWVSPSWVSLAVQLLRGEAS
jgi:hypothetical protein